MLMLFLAVIAFVGSHLIMSAPQVRPRLVGSLGETPFLGLYSLISFATLAWIVVAFRAAPYDPVLWNLGAAGAGINHLFMLLALLFLVIGYSQRNPSAIGQTSALDLDDPSYGITRLTRHPIMWGMACWATGHLIANGEMRMVILTLGILVVSLVGAWSLDRKLVLQHANKASRFLSRTSFVPGGAIIGGQQSVGMMLREIGFIRPVIVLIVYLVLFYTHRWYTGIPLTS